MRIAIVVAVALAAACSATAPQEPPKPAAPAEATPSAPAEATAAEPATELGERRLPDLAPVSLPPPASRNTGRAKELVERGRAVQRERGEGGANDAIKLYGEALREDAFLAEAYWEMGWSYQQLGDLDAAVRAWDRVREIDPKYPELERHYPVLALRRQQKDALAKLPEPGVLSEPESEPGDGAGVTLAAVGDIQMGRGWPEERATLPPNDAAGFFAAIEQFLAKADVAFGNVETALADSGQSTKCGPASTKCFAFRVPTSYAKEIQRAGFDVVSIANNHAGDFGEEGRASTMRALDAVALKYSGPVGVLASWETNGLKMGMVAFSTGAGSYRIQELDVARKVVAELDREHDLVIVSFHGGAEGTSAARVPKAEEVFYGEKRGDVHAFAHTVIDAGADLVLGHGPHLWRGLEIYKDRLIAYSMGNFCTWETFNLTGPLGITGVLQVKLATNGVVMEVGIDPVIIEKPGLPKPDPKRQVIDIVRKLSRDDFGDALLDASGRWVRPGAAPATKAKKVKKVSSR